MKILLVEDSRIVRDRLRGIINNIPGCILVAASDNEDDARLQLDKHHPDLAVIDLRLKGGSGLSVLSHIKAMQSATIIIVLTNLAQTEYRVSCLRLGAHYFFDKSKDIAAFTQLLVDRCKGSAVQADPCRAGSP